MGERTEAGGKCLLGRSACGDCLRCGWNSAVAERRKRDIRRGVRSARERELLTAARKTAVPDGAGWYSARKALPEPGERVIVTDGAFVGEAYMSRRGVWLRYGVRIVDEKFGISAPVAWMPLPEYERGGRT